MLKTGEVERGKGARISEITCGKVKGISWRGRECDFAVDWLAERGGFEPTVPFRTTVFETVRIGHSRTSPTDIFLKLDRLSLA